MSQPKPNQALLDTKARQAAGHDPTNRIPPAKRQNSRFTTSKNKRILIGIAIICILVSIGALIFILISIDWKNSNSSSTNIPTSYNFTVMQEYQGDTFFDGFTFYAGVDPTNGYVNYVNQSYANETGLINTSDTHIYMSADSTNIANDYGRKSVRIETKATFNGGLFILSLNHMPAGCGTWPSYWTVGPDWPTYGEIDIIEGINSQTKCRSALHTSDSCSMASVVDDIVFNGTWANNTNNEPATDCYIYAENQVSNLGCPQWNAVEASFGSKFNSKGGGYFVLLWDNKINDLINIWFFNNKTLPDDIWTVVNGNSSMDYNLTDDPINDWGIPNSQYLFGDDFCDREQFKDHSLIFDLAFCGDWAGNDAVWSGDAECSTLANNTGCQDFVKNNPSYFTEAYWDINFLKVFSLYYYD